MVVLSSVWSMIGLDGLMVLYTVWVLSLGAVPAALRWRIAAGLIVWLTLLHVELSERLLVPTDLSGSAFFGVVLACVGAVGALLWGVPSLRRILLSIPQHQLLLLQGVRVFFGAMFLAHAAVGVLPVTFGVLDGLTHVGAGFFGLIAAYALNGGPNGPRRAWFANVFGLLDILLVASSLAFLLLPQIGPHHMMMYAVFLPAPLWLWIHVASIWRLAMHDDAASVSSREWPAPATQA